MLKAERRDQKKTRAKAKAQRKSNIKSIRLLAIKLGIAR
jgi:hypothetical protein